LVTGGVLYAKTVTDTEANNVAQNLAYKKNGKSFKVKKSVNDTILLKQVSKDQQLDNEPTIRLVKLSPQGWVIVSGDDKVVPTIGYSFKNNFDENNLPPQLIAMLEGYAKQIQDLRTQNADVPLETSQAWDILKEVPTKYKEKHPFETQNIKTTRATKWKMSKDEDLATPPWGQWTFYNQHTPDHAPTGCVATAMAEIMGLHRWPMQSIGLTSYTDYNEYLEPDGSPSCPPAKGLISVILPVC